MFDWHPSSYILAAAIWCIIVTITKSRLAARKLNKIPCVCGPGAFNSWIGAFKSITGAPNMIQDGYEKYRGKIFRIPTLTGWKIVLTTPKQVDELRLAKNDELSLHEALNQLLLLKYFFGPAVHRDPYHIDIIRGPLTRNIAACYPETRDEMLSAFASHIPPSREYVKYPALDTTLKIISRITNRGMVGLPLCQNPDYLALVIGIPIRLVKASVVINTFPSFLQPWAAKLFFNFSGPFEKLIGPIIQERLDNEERYGPDWPGKPNDMLTWLIEQTKDRPERRTIQDLSRRVLLGNLGAIHTTTMAVTSALYALAERPDLVASLREEIESVIGHEGWSKASLGHLTKLDSFIRESNRLTQAGILHMPRVVVKDFTFSDGTVVPAGPGHLISVAGRSLHMDNEHYPNASKFEALRFSKMREEEGAGEKFQGVSTSTNYIIFGHGRHACPGRFYAIASITSILAHVLVTYDIKFEDGKSAPPDLWFLDFPVPDTKAQLLFRTRAT
ncbi:cytochrome P450 [Mycena floridula]|nr:cytochrome P450 [Mycena floridula]